ncbi:Hypothetical predicted protein [Cloeon dipterum]|uniref:Uncharacterized protein n=1 Tax=Cloeon dipterum TaxID=197152 RepID=A0A8S1CBT0_9INSE|nr:Hypothetical predicted protein [Cloeon dipterum]
MRVPPFHLRLAANGRRQGAAPTPGSRVPLARWPHMAPSAADGMNLSQPPQTEFGDMLLDLRDNCRAQAQGPLTALTSMTESKTPPPGSSASSSPRLPATPHGIEHILNKPSALPNAHNPQPPLNQRLAAAVAAANMYFNPAMHQQLGRSNPALYWPGLQGLVANPLAWRDRLGAHKIDRRDLLSSCCQAVDRRS